MSLFGINKKNKTFIQVKDSFTVTLSLSGITLNQGDSWTLSILETPPASYQPRCSIIVLPVLASTSIDPTDIVVNTYIDTDRQAEIGSGTCCTITNNGSTPYVNPQLQITYIQI